MKKGKRLYAALVAILLSVCAVPAVYPYSVKFTNNVDKAVFANAQDSSGNFYPNSYGVFINSGEVKTVNNTDWKTAGLCWEKVSVYPAEQWQGCEPRHWIHSFLPGCSNLDILFVRNGCNIEIYKK